MERYSIIHLDGNLIKCTDLDENFACIFKRGHYQNTLRYEDYNQEKITDEVLQPLKSQMSEYISRNYNTLMIVEA